MRISFILFTLLLLFNGLNSQVIVSNYCDSSFLSKEAYHRCKLDSIFDTDIIARTNYHIHFKTKILLKFRNSLKFGNLPSPIQLQINSLSRFYDSTLIIKREIFLKDADRLNGFLQPKSYINSVLALEEFAIYPDTYAILVNPIHLSLRPKTRPEVLDSISMKISKVYSSLPAIFQKSVIDYARSLREQKIQLDLQFGLTRLFQGPLSESDRTIYDVIDFLIWIEKYSN